MRTAGRRNRRALLRHQRNAAEEGRQKFSFSPPLSLSRCAPRATLPLPLPHSVSTRPPPPRSPALSPAQVAMGGEPAAKKRKDDGVKVSGPRWSRVSVSCRVPPAGTLVAPRSSVRSLTHILPSCSCAPGAEEAARFHDHQGRLDQRGDCGRVLVRKHRDAARFFSHSRPPSLAISRRTTRSSSL